MFKVEEDAAVTVKSKVEEAVDKDATTEEVEEYRESKVEEDAAVTVEVDKVTGKATREEAEEYSESDCDSDEEASEDDETFLARIAAEFNAREEKMMANYPEMTYRDYELDPLHQSVDDDEDDTPYEYDDAYYHEYFRRKQQQEAAGSHAVDGPAVL